MKKILFISLLTSTLFAEQGHVLSDFFIDKDVSKIDNEASFGKKSTYSLLYAKHELSTQEKDLHFYYGAKMGVVSEEYTTENGFGIPVTEIGTYLAATAGMEYDIDKTSMLVAEAIRYEDHTYDRKESKVQLTYTYNY